MYTCGRVEGQRRTECDKGLPSFQFSPPPQKKTHLEALYPGFEMSKKKNVIWLIIHVTWVTCVVD